MSATYTPSPKAVRVMPAGPSLESYAAELAAKFPELTHTTVAASIESQQLDRSERQAALDDVRDTLDAYDKDHPRTGPMHVFLLDGKGVAGMDEQNEGPLRAVVAQSLADPRHTVAALLPEDETASKVEHLSPATLLRAMADTVLATESITVLVGKAALEAYLNDRAIGIPLGG